MRRSLVSNLILAAVCFAALVHETKQCKNRKQAARGEEESEKPANAAGIAGLPADCGKVPLAITHKRRPTSEKRIAGGYDAYAGQFPAYIRIDATCERPGGWVTLSCGGTLISDRHILTAAHCLEGALFVSAYLTFAGVQTYDAERAVPEYSTKMCTSKKYATDGGNGIIFDIAIIKLHRPVQFTKLIQPACLPKKQIGFDTQAHAVGLGFTHYPRAVSREERAEKLQVLPVKRVACSEQDAPDKSRLCFKANNGTYLGDTCFGDSGGGVFTLEDGRLTVQSAASYSNQEYWKFRCEKGLVGLTMHANVYSLREEIDALLQECA